MDVLVVAGDVLDAENIFAVVEAVDAGSRYERFVSVWQAVTLLVFAADSLEAALYNGGLD